MTTKICPVSGQEFSISAAEQEFYRRIQVPEPTLCPQERLRRRLAYKNPKTVCRRKSSASGEMIFSMYNEKAPFPVIEKDIWWSDEFDPIDYGRDFDLSKPFFEQFDALSCEVPRFPLSIIRIENSEYVNNASGLNRCYLVFSANNLEDCIYCIQTHDSKDCLECTQVTKSELCYNCITCHGCYNLQESIFCENCSDSFFLRNCKSCQHCFGCVNLYRKQYHIYNKAHSKEEFEQFIKKYELERYSVRQDLREKTEQFFKENPQPALMNTHVEDVRGEYLYESRRVFDSFLVLRSEDVRYGFELQDVKTSMDYCIWGCKAELMYECSVCGNNAYNLRFCYECYENVSDLEYCQYCIGCRDCFGCVGLKKKQFCIFNQQYSKAEYLKLRDRIRDLMLETKEYGEFFPIEKSPIPYNHSYAQMYFPLDKDEVLKRGWSWYEIDAPVAKGALLAEDLGDALPEHNKGITVRSAVSEIPFYITPQEIQRYRHLKVPLPRITYEERILERLEKGQKPHLYEARCAKSDKTLLTSYPPDSDWILWDRKLWEKEFMG